VGEKAGGIDLAECRAQLVPAGGWSKADTVATLIELAYPGVRIEVLFDGGSDTSAEAGRILALSGGGVVTRVLERRDIEAYFSPAAIAAWLLLGGARHSTWHLSQTRPRVARRSFRISPTASLHRRQPPAPVFRHLRPGAR
jgi:hypothetical protein